LLLINASLAATLTVSSGGTYSTIQSAVDAASNGDTVQVSSGTYSGCVDLSGKDLTLTGAGSGTTTISVSSCSSGALIMDSGEHATVTGLTIENSSGVGVLIDNAASVLFVDIVIESSGNVSSSIPVYGGGMIIQGSSDVDISGSTFEDNIADYGAGIFIEASTLSLSKVSFVTNDVGYSGGGIRADSGAELTLSGCTFDSNSTSLASGKGGAIAMSGDVVMTDYSSSFSNNFAGNYGGAISAESDVELELYGTLFDGNFVDRTAASPISGGAIYATAMETFEMDSVTFIDNVAYLYGGAIHCSGMNFGKTMTVKDSTFSGNEVQSKRGGALYIDAGTDLEIIDSVFDGNTAPEAGGALAFYTLYNTQDAVITGTTFTGNVTTSTSDAHGAGVFAYSFSASSSLEISDCSFTDNTAYLSGGGVYTSNVDNVTISGSTFEGNLASQIAMTSRGNFNGGAISIYAADTVALSTLSICDNTGDDGGGVYLDQVADFSMSNSIFVENTAGNDGGGLYLYDVDGEVGNNNFLGGSALLGGAVYFASGSAIDFWNNIVAYTASGTGVVADSTSGSTSSFTYNDWYSNTSSDRGGTLSFSTSTNGNITDDPDFSSYTLDGNCSNDSFILDSSSALIDAGDPSLSDPDGSDSDIGAYGGPGSQLVDDDGDGYYLIDDCDDSDADVNPGETEICDDKDNDCDGEVDNGASDATTVYPDEDGDGYGDTAGGELLCEVPSGYVTDGSDCNDSNSAVNPSASEVCDGIDNDCDGNTDDSSSTGLSTWYSDVDGDGYGSTFDIEESCTQPSGYVDNVTDCDDSDASIYPGADEYCDGDDNDCDGDTDEDGAVDAPSWYADLDGDGYGVSTFTKESCFKPSSYASVADDCDDGDSAINPGADEYCDGDDNDCDGSTDESDAIDASTYYDDSDGDGYGDASSSTTACSTPSGHVTSSDDCDDSDSTVNPGADEYCNGTDDDCDGEKDEDDALDALTFYVDSDSDGYGDVSVTASACYAPDGFVLDGTDCDDTQSSVSPGADEYCNGTDDDCDGEIDNDAVDSLSWYTDSDGDGYGDPSTELLDCDAVTGAVEDGTDCDDTDQQVNPGQEEVPYDGIDNDCDGADLTDADGDGYNGVEVGGDDCDDTDSSINPGASEVDGDGVDQDCDGSSEPGLDSDSDDDSKQGCSAAGGSGASVWVLLGMFGVLTRRRRAAHG
jgi:uncharacterized protein (TIGR03382 family)